MELVVVIDGREVVVTNHALERYAERIRPGLLPSQIEDDMIHVLTVAGEFGPCPDWVNDHEGGLRGRADDWLWLGEDAALALLNGVAVTCVARGSISDARRAEKARRRQRQSLVRQAYKQQGRFREKRREA